MEDIIDLNWTTYVSYFVPKYDVFKALAKLYDYCCESMPEKSDGYDQFIIDWLKNNLEDYIGEFLSILRGITSVDYNVDGEIDDDNITKLLDNKEFMKEFKQYLND